MNKTLAVASLFFYLLGPLSAQQIPITAPIPFADLHPYAGGPALGGTKPKGWFYLPISEKSYRFYVVKEAGGYAPVGPGSLPMNILGEIMAIREVLAGDFYSHLLGGGAPSTRLVLVAPGTMAILNAVGTPSQNRRLVASEFLNNFTGMNQWQTEFFQGPTAPDGITAAWIVSKFLGESDVKTDNYGWYQPGVPNGVYCKIDHGGSFDWADPSQANDQWLNAINGNRVEIAGTAGMPPVSWEMNPTEKASIIQKIKDLTPVAISTAVGHYETDHFINYRNMHPAPSLAPVIGAKNSIATELKRRLELIRALP